MNDNYESSWSGASRRWASVGGVLLTSILGLTDVVGFSSILELDEFGWFVATSAWTASIYGFLEVRYGEVVLIVKRKLTDCNTATRKAVVASIALEVAAIILAMLVGSTIGVHLGDMNPMVALAASLSMITGMTLGQFRILLSAHSSVAIAYWSPVVLRLLPSVIVICGVLNRGKNLEILMCVYALACLVSIALSLVISLLHLDQNRADEGVAIKARESSFWHIAGSNWLTSAASGLYRQADIVWASLVLSPVELGALRLWGMVTVPLSILAELRFNSRMATFAGLPALRDGRFKNLLALVAIGSLVFLFSYVHDDFLDTSWLGVLVLVNAIVALRGADSRALLLRESQFTYLASLSWITVAVYFCVFGTFAVLTDSIAAILAGRVVVSVGVEANKSHRLRRLHSSHWDKDYG